MIGLKIRGPDRRKLINQLKYELKIPKNQRQELSFKTISLKNTKLMKKYGQQIPQIINLVQPSKQISIKKQLPTEQQFSEVFKKFQPHYRLRYTSTKKNYPNMQMPQQQCLKRSITQQSFGQQKQLSIQLKRSRTLQLNKYSSLNTSVNQYIDKLLRFKQKNEKYKTIQTQLLINQLKGTIKMDFKPQPLQIQGKYLSRLFQGQLQTGLCKINQIKHSEQKIYQPKKHKPTNKKFKYFTYSNDNKHQKQQQNKIRVKKIGASNKLLKSRKQKVSEFKSTFGPWRNSGFSLAN